jgi:toxin YoeB
VKIVWFSKALGDYRYWNEHEPRIAQKIVNLLVDIQRSPFSGIGKPEPLKANLSGWWARRITGEHRLVYRLVGKRGANQRLEILQCRFHY